MTDEAGATPGWPCARPLVKWAGGKSGELDVIGRALPTRIGRLLEPFAGGGAVLFAAPACIPAEANDLCADLIGLYRLCQGQDAGLLAAMEAIIAAWSSLGAVAAGPGLHDAEMAEGAAAACAPLAAIDHDIPAAAGRWALVALARKRLALARIADAGTEPVEPEKLLSSALRSAAYTAIRDAYNGSGLDAAGRAAVFWFIRDFCYSGMFRQNASGALNVPYGGMSYDRRSMETRLAQLRGTATAERLAAAVFHCGDFAAFLTRARPRRSDFVFLDPPYDARFSAYDGNAFGQADHLRLAASLRDLPCRWMLVISETPFVRDAYCGLPGARVASFAKLYGANIKQRFTRRATHLLITNYDHAGLAADGDFPERLQAVDVRQAA